MKKIIAMTLVAAMTLTMLVGCGAKETAATTASAESERTTFTVGFDAYKNSGEEKGERNEIA